jgi:hypothetical protein
MLSRSLTLFLGTALAAGAFVFAGGGDVTTEASQREKPKVRLLTPKKGDVFRPGDVVTITWEFVGRDGRPPADTNWCEQEIFLSLDGGRTNARRITLALTAEDRSFEWTVPDTPTDRAVLDMHYGCDTVDSPMEVSNKQISSMFRILPADKPGAGELTLNRLPTTVKAGESLTLSWNSSIPDARAYQVAVSYDRGGEFIELGSTNATVYDWTVPAQFAGTLTFQVSTTTRDGKTVVSPVTPTSTTRVRR